MAGTNIHYPDDVYTHNHTYQGNGCENIWDTTDRPYFGGSIVSCATNLTKTQDDETQKIGTYYNFAALNAGSGAGGSFDNANYPDTFCPLGWQMPYGGTGGDYYNKSRSWMYLFEQYSLINDPASAEQFLSYPFSTILSGDYHWTTGALYHLDDTGKLATKTSATLERFYQTMINHNEILQNQTILRSDGSSIRCIFGISNLEKLSMASA